MFAAWVVLGLEPGNFSDTQRNQLAYLPSDEEEKVRLLMEILNIPALAPSSSQVAREISFQANCVRFIQLPSKIIDLVKSTIQRQCANCKKLPEEPAVCLVCNEILCVACDACKKGTEGECSRHAKKCGEGQGLCILPFSSGILAISESRCGLWDGPYLDARGENDHGMRRSVNLTLNQRRLDELHRMLVRGTIDIEIVRHNERTGRYVPTQL
jgi:hypothetical protein